VDDHRGHPRRRAGPLELTEGDEVLWSGVGDDPAEGLLQIIMRIVDGEDPDAPND
jgi:hypothetical protein